MGGVRIPTGQRASMSRLLCHQMRVGQWVAIGGRCCESRTRTAPQAAFARTSLREVRVTLLIVSEGANTKVELQKTGRRGCSKDKGQ